MWKKFITNKKFQKWTIIIVSLVVTFIYMLYSNLAIKVETYDLSTAEANKIKIVHISDTHFDKQVNSINYLVNKIAKQKPDLLLFTGDLIDKDYDFSTNHLGEFLEKIKGLAPMYAVSGNHEEINDKDKWFEVLKNKGVVIVENTFVNISIKNRKLRIIGLSNNMTYNSDYVKNLSAETEDRYNILLSHHPELINYFKNENNKIIPNLVLAGHAHGGQFRMPFIGGLIAPDQGFFPKYTSGLYKLSDKTNLIVSRGLGSSIIPVRINNFPHLPVIYI